MNIEKAYGWDTAPLEELLEFYIGGDWGKDPDFDDDAMELAYCIRGSEIRNWNENKGNTASLRKIKKTNIAKRKLIVDDILVEISGGGPEQPVGRTVLIDKTALSFEPSVPKICTNFLRLIRPKDSINSKFLDLYLKFFYNSGEIIKFQNGSNNLRNLIFPEFLKIEIPFPLPDEQHEIVEKIEELFSELDKGIENLKTVQQQLKVYRQAVLKWAFEGKLTNENIKDGELPEGWGWKSLITLGNLGRGKSKHRPRNEKKLFGGKYPFIQTGEVKAAGHIIKKFEQTYSDFGLSQSKLWPKGTLCITIAANIAEVAFLGFDGCFPDSIVGFTPNMDIVESEYIYYFFKGNQSRLEAFAPATAQKNINLNTLENLIIPYCSLEQQREIINEIESRLSVCDKMEETITTSLLQAEALRQSILKRAFEGKLIKSLHHEIT